MAAPRANIQIPALSPGVLEKERINVLMWGHDSLSRNTFIRKLPNTFSYLTEKLDSVILKGYNIVGDGMIL